VGGYNTEEAQGKYRERDCEMRCKSACRAESVILSSSLVCERDMHCVA
jgi:hypothetical protein